MKRLPLVLFIITLLLPQSLVYAGDFKTAKISDYGTYAYFQSFLDEFNDILKGLASDNVSSSTIIGFVNVTSVTQNTVKGYSTFGIPKSSLLVATQFAYLGNDTLSFYKKMLEFNKLMKVRDYAGARNTLVSLSGILDDMTKRVEILSEVRFRTENGTYVSFNMSRTIQVLDDLYGLVKGWENTLNQLEAPKGLVLYLGSERVILNESVSFYGYCPNLTNVTVFIDGTPYAPEIVGDSFSLNHTFVRPGVHVVYATALNGSIRVKSNVLNITVLRIPTTIVAHQEGMSLRGILMDYSGKGIRGRVILLGIGSRNYTVETSFSGNFSFLLPNSFKGGNVTVVFPGTNVYAPSSLTLTLRPPKKPLSIEITAGSTTVKEGPVEIEGRIVGTNERIPLEVYVDGNLSSVVEAGSNFTLTVTLRKGVHTVYVRFPGNDEYAEAVSNALKFNVQPVSYLHRIAVLVLLLALGFVGYLTLSRVKGGKTETSGVSSLGEEKAFPEGRLEGQTDPVSAYRVVYGLLLRLYRLPRSTTPRELLSKFRNSPFGSWLSEATVVHEKALYRKAKLKAEEVAMAVKAVALTIVSIFVGDEL
ncbi:hypothetical protein [Thermococcus sp.]|uniref:hypothetical protein n=1 Tax=Thermococcus sp. TaxID=35749 RepID=UPI00262D3128|nr:hypothetical protein [Thermococcus sp.]